MQYFEAGMSERMFDERMNSFHGPSMNPREQELLEALKAERKAFKTLDDYAITLTGTHPDDIHKSRDERIEVLELDLRNHDFQAKSYLEEHGNWGDCKFRIRLENLPCYFDWLWKEDQRESRVPPCGRCPACAAKEKAPEKEADS
jgi:hypothetical protein